MFELNLDYSQYSQMPYPTFRVKLQPLTKKDLEAMGFKLPPAEKPTFRMETVTKDTGERKEMFGYVARHVITTRKEIPLEGSWRHAQEMITNGWYIDLEPEFNPSLYYLLPRPNLPGKSSKRGGVLYLSGSSKVPEKWEFLDVGEPETGFALQELRTTRNTITSPDVGIRHNESRDESLVSLEKGVYDVALFEVPSGFRRVQYINRNPVAESQRM
jgi:hypothetical protein